MSTEKPIPQHKRPTVEIDFAEGHFRIDDNCGGIGLTHALEEAFNFGIKVGESKSVQGSLGVFRVGMKRAIFKMGTYFRIESQTVKSGFKADWDIDKWVEKDDDFNDWKLPLEPTQAATSPDKAGTRIEITRLHPAVATLFRSKALENTLRQSIAQTYALFVGRFVDIRVNGKLVPPQPIPLSRSTRVHNAVEHFKDLDVDVVIVAGLQRKDHERDEWNGETAGWYVLCNGRVVVRADKSKLTGWGAGTLPQWHGGKFRAFVGVVSFESSNGFNLPWTTTKRGLNQESLVWQRSKIRAEVLGRQVVSFIDSLYRVDDSEKPNIASLQHGLQEVDFRDVITQAPSDPTPFIASVAMKKAAMKDQLVNISYARKRALVQAVKEHLRNAGLSNKKVGEHTFDYFVKAHDLDGED